MLKTSLLTIAGVALLGTASVPVDAAILSVSGSGKIIGAPSSVGNSGEGDNEFMLGFDEKQNVLLTEDLNVDGGTIAKGTRVNSHMIFLNREDNNRNLIELENVLWTFDGAILGLMSDSRGTLEAATNELLGAEGTTYPGSFRARGFEDGDPGDNATYNILGDELSVSMRVTQPGDWIRVVTADVPEPASMVGLLAVGAVGLGAARKRKQASA